MQRAFLQCLEGNDCLDWTLTKLVTIGFYRDLHRYLRHWPPARSATKTMVGRFYVLVDKNFKHEKPLARPDNVYIFVQNVATSTRSGLEPMYYGMDRKIKNLENVACGCKNKIKEITHKVSEQQEGMKRKVEVASEC